MEKYYDLIVELVKAHRKYSEYVSILDDIVDDVCNQAKTVLETVKDETVVESYLNKIVATSMITVPKRLGLTKTRQTNIILPEKTEVYAQEDDSVIENFVEESLSTAEEFTDEQIEETPLIEVSEADESFVENDIVAETDVVETDLSQDIVVDKDLVDKMINGVSSEDAGLPDTDVSVLAADEEVSSDLELSFDSDTDGEFIVEESNTEEYTVEEPEPIFEEPTAEISDDAVVEAQPEESEFAEETSALLDTLYPADDLVSEDENFADSESFAADIDFSEQDNFSLDSDDVEELEETSPEDFVTESSDDFGAVSSDTDEATIGDSFTPPSYKLFGYTPDEQHTDWDEIISEVKELDAKNPDKHILDVCTAKYKECKNINEISEELNIGVDSIIEALNEIIYLVKD